MSSSSSAASGGQSFGGVSAPTHVALAHKLLQQMAHEQLKTGDRLGTELDLSKRHGVSRQSVRQALSILAKDGYISRKRRTGTTVAKTPDDSHQLGLLRGTIAVICPNEIAEPHEEDTASLRVIHSIDEELAKHGFAFQLIGIGRDATADQVRLRQLSRRHDIVGICSPWDCVEPYHDLLPDVPVVVTGFHSKRFPLVGVDIRAACKESISFLMSCGHTDIAVVCGPWISPQVFGLFAEGYREAFRSAGLAYERSLLYLAHPGEDVETLAQEVLSRRPRPTAVFGDNYRICHAMFSAAGALNLRVPEDLSLIGYGESVMRMHSQIPVTAYNPANDEIAKKAVDLLVSMINGHPTPGQPVIIPGKLVERDSVRCVAAGADDRADRR